MTRMHGYRYIILHGFTLPGSVPIRNWGSENMSWEDPLILTVADRFTCTEDEVVHGKTRVGTSWGGENAAGNLFLPRTGSVAGPGEGNSSIRATVVQVSVQSSYNGEILVHNLGTG